MIKKRVLFSSFRNFNKGRTTRFPKKKEIKKKERLIRERRVS